MNIKSLNPYCDGFRWYGDLNILVININLPTFMICKTVNKY